MKVKITKDCEFRGVEYKKGETHTVEGKTYRVLKMWNAISKPTKKSKSKETPIVAPSLDE
jgi:hypothetical protein